MEFCYKYSFIINNNNNDKNNCDNDNNYNVVYMLRMR